MMFYALAIIGICYLGYRLTLAMPCGKEEPLTDDEMEWLGYDR